MAGQAGNSGVFFALSRQGDYTASEIKEIALLPVL